MPVIKPISDLRNNFTQISETVHAANEPVFLTKNGSGDMVVMSIEYYDEQIAKLDLYQKLDVARKEIEAGAVGTDAQYFIKTLMSK